ncbi:hypothetical protein QBC34DRAFT_496935 [Podospora aff. communis PSN243]|uniref:Uncharacterized protein n=1 Tax=Podospora aff. communis PSN243 TaxID=3040156 RepID=A0AAV9GEB3_9PEZI|nr:hypothetical protein QBC34DRAFT_496935 [Podospora aff. communis PSN243]
MAHKMNHQQKSRLLEDIQRGDYSTLDIELTVAARKHDTTKAHILQSLIDPQGRNILHHAAHHNKDGIKFLRGPTISNIPLDVLASLVSQEDSNGETPFLYAIRHTTHLKSIEVIAELSSEADESIFFATNTRGMGAAHIAAEVDNVAALKYLRNGEFNVNAPMENGDRPVHIAARLGCVKTLKFLSSVESTSILLHCRNKTGKCAVELACAHGRQAAISFIQDTFGPDMERYARFRMYLVGKVTGTRTCTGLARKSPWPARTRVLKESKLSVMRLVDDPWDSDEDAEGNSVSEMDWISGTDSEMSAGTDSDTASEGGGGNKRSVEGDDSGETQTRSGTVMVVRTRKSQVDMEVDDNPKRPPKRGRSSSPEEGPRRNGFPMSA